MNHINTVINTVGDPADIWNNLAYGYDKDSIMKMIRQSGGDSIQDAHVIVGKHVMCMGATGFGSWGATIK